MRLSHRQAMIDDHGMMMMRFLDRSKKGTKLRKNFSRNEKWEEKKIYWSDESIDEGYLHAFLPYR